MAPVLSPSVVKGSGFEGDDFGCRSLSSGPSDEEGPVALGLAGAAAAVNGGSKGMGRATAQCLAAGGARVAVLARGREAREETVEALRALGSPDPIGLSVDTTDEPSVRAGFKEIE